MTIETAVLPEALPLLRLRLTLRMLQDAALPAAKGPLLRGGFGYAFKRASCPPICHKPDTPCGMAMLCPYRWFFETPRHEGVRELHDLQDIPRPFVFEPPDDGRTFYRAGSVLELGATLIGRGTAYLPFFIQSFLRLGDMGLGRDEAKFRLERVEAPLPWGAIGPAVFVDGRVVESDMPLPFIEMAEIRARAAALPNNLVLRIETPLRLKSAGQFQHEFDLQALIRSICWRLSALSIFHTDAPWRADLHSILDLLTHVRVETRRLTWVELERVSRRGGVSRTMPQGGVVGEFVLRDVPEQLRALLVYGSLIHAGKSCTFGHGAFTVVPLREGR